MKNTIASRLLTIALLLGAVTWLSPSLVSAGERVQYTQFTFGPLTTRALFPGVNLAGPGMQDTDWYPVYLVRDPYACPGEFPEDHLLVYNMRQTSPDPSYHFACPLLIEGFGILEDASAMFPRVSNLWAGHVPVYFVHKDDVSLAMTWGELSDLLDDGCALRGMAHRYREILQTGSPDPVTMPGGANVPSFNISLSGYLEDGTRFSVHTAGQVAPGPTFPSGIVRTYRVKGLADKENVCSLR